MRSSFAKMPMVLCTIKSRSIEINLAPYKFSPSARFLSSSSSSTTSSWLVLIIFRFFIFTVFFCSFNYSVLFSFDWNLTVWLVLFRSHQTASQFKHATARPVENIRIQSILFKPIQTKTNTFLTIKINSIQNRFQVSLVLFHFILI